jgi:hypothetical protein
VLVNLAPDQIRAEGTLHGAFLTCFPISATPSADASAVRLTRFSGNFWQQFALVPPDPRK